MRLRCLLVCGNSCQRFLKEVLTLQVFQKLILSLDRYDGLLPFGSSSFFATTIIAEWTLYLTLFFYRAYARS